MSVDLKSRLGDIFVPYRDGTLGSDWWKIYSEEAGRMEYQANVWRYIEAVIT